MKAFPDARKRTKKRSLGERANKKEEGEDGFVNFSRLVCLTDDRKPILSANRSIFLIL